MQEKENKQTRKILQKESQGITLIALVVTIVVLLILAGVSIIVLFGDNGIIKQAEESTLQTKLAEIEERANVAYADLNSGKYADGNSNKKITMQDVAEKLNSLNNEKYKIAIVPLEGNIVKEIKLDQESIRLAKGGRAYIEATLILNESKANYYAKVEEKYYEISLNNNHITLDKTNGKTEEQIGNLGIEQTKEIIAVSNNTSVVEIVNKTQKETGATIEIKGGETLNEETSITISYEGVSSVTCKVTIIDEQMAQWEYLERVAKDIATRTDINADSPRASGKTELNEPYDIYLGKTYTVKYNNEATLRTVRVLGFKHDDLADQTVYRDKNNPEDTRTWEKAGISFDFVDYLSDRKYQYMNISNTNSNGWAATWMRQYLNGYNSQTATAKIGVLGGEAIKLSNSSQIKKVKKEYIAKYDTKVETLPQTEDYLWLLSCAEIWKDGYKEGTAGDAIQKEGSQYQYYKNVQVTESKTYKYNDSNPSLVKKGNSLTYASFWWLRSPHYNMSIYFCGVTSSGDCGSLHAGQTYGVAPGFSI